MLQCTPDTGQIVKELVTIIQTILYTFQLLFPNILNCFALYGVRTRNEMSADTIMKRIYTYWKPCEGRSIMYTFLQLAWMVSSNIYKIPIPTLIGLLPSPDINNYTKYKFIVNLTLT